MSEINEQLSHQSLYIKTGEITIIDARVIQAKQNSPHKGSDGRLKITYGFKAHITVEEEGFVA